MAKKNTSLDFSKREFESNAEIRRQNVNNIEVHIKDLSIKLESIRFKVKETEFIVKQGIEGQRQFDPKFKYETQEDYLLIQLERQQYVLRELKEQEEKILEMIEKDKQSLNNEKTRLRLIEQGLPAWLDDVYNAHGTE